MDNSLQNVPYTYDEFCLLLQVPAAGLKEGIYSQRKPIPPKPTFGALDFGGASLQVTFVPEDPSSVPASKLAKLRLYGTDYQVFTHSFLCYGADEIRRRLEATLIKVITFLVFIIMCYILLLFYSIRPTAEKTPITEKVIKNNLLQKYKVHFTQFIPILKPAGCVGKYFI